MNEAQQMIVPSEEKKWFTAFLFTVGYGALVVAYMFLVYGGIESLSFWSSVTAAVAGCMLATSLTASSFSYFTGWPNMRLGYQKQIGVLAFWLCVGYCITLLILEPEIYFYGLYENLFTPNIIFGLVAMAIFGLMVFMNSKLVAPHFSWPTIRFFLNLGYWGYAALVVRAVFLEGPTWINWFLHFEGPPTNRFLLSTLAVAVIGLRIAAVQSKKRQGSGGN